MNKFTYFLLTAILLSILTSFIYSQSGWYQVTSPATQELYGLYFKDINIGVCDKFKTTSGGQNWNQPLTGSSYAIMFPDPNIGWRTGTGIYKTTNLGDNWVLQPNPTGTSVLYGIYFINVNTGYACGELAKIIKTTNSGINWVLLTSPISNSYYLNCIYFIDANIGFAAGYTTSGNPSVIIKTIDGGLNWNVQNFPTGTGYSAISFVNSMTGIVVGIKAAKTTDGGTTWVSKSLPVEGFLYSMHFPSVNTGYAVGFGGTILKTTDIGETWYQQACPVGTLRTIYFIDDNTGYACGNNGAVIKTTDGGGPPIGITPISTEVPSSYNLYQNYPNPFNPSTKIRFSIPQQNSPFEGGRGDDVVKLVVFDILGKEIAVLVNEQLSPGTYEIEWNASDYPSGVYFYTLVTGVFSQTRKLILMK
ncbi:MAG: T9SS C-terminal target domain-containing protein [Ignavibacteriae bacterium]|nr:MAG: T9SS C-terminal target domain-containing protein [Ignavibacteriota bacterium]